MIKKPGVGRKGVALLSCLVVMAIGASILVAVVFQELFTRKKFEFINLDTKAQNLAFSGRDLALSFILQDELGKMPLTINPEPASGIMLKVVETRKNCYQVDVNAQCSERDKKPVRASFTGVFLLDTQGGKRSLTEIEK